MGLNETLESYKLFLWICGVWPKECRRKPNFSRTKLYFSISNILLLFFLTFAGIVTVGTTENTPEFILEGVGYIAGVSKMIPFLMNRKRMQKLIVQTIKLEELSECENDSELEIMRFWRFVRDKIIKYYGRIIIFDLIQYCILPMLLKLKTFPVQTIIQASSFDGLWFGFIYAFYCIELFIFTSIVISTDIYFIILICKLCEELQYLECLLLDKHRYTKSSMKNQSTLGKANDLQRVIRKHCTVLKYGENMCGLLTRSFFMQYFCISIGMGLISFIIITSNSREMANRLYVEELLFVLQLFVISLAGELISTRSVGLADALLQSDLCCSNFGKLKASELKQIVLIQMRMQKPLIFSVGTNSIINFDLFSRTMKGVYSFVMLLRTFYA